MDNSTTLTDNQITEQIIYEFAKKCNYLVNQRFEHQCHRYAVLAMEVCKRMKVDPATYIDAHVLYSPIIRGYATLIPNQICTKDSERYITDFISTKGERYVNREFEAQCNMLGLMLENNWTEKLALRNPTIDFSPWFRILIAVEPDLEVIKMYGGLARQILTNDKELLDYLKTVKSDDGKKLDFNRIPNLNIS